MFQPLAILIAEMLLPLTDALKDPGAFTAFLRALGWDVAFDDALDDVLDDLQPVSDAVTALADLMATFNNDPQAGEVVADIIVASETVFSEIDAIPGIFDQTTRAGLPAPLDTAEFWTNLAADVPEYLVVFYLRWRYPFVYAAFKFAGVIETYETTDDPPRMLDRLVLDNLSSLVADPGNQVDTVYGWSNGPFDYARFVENATLLVQQLGLPAYLETPGRQVSTIFYPGLTPAELRQASLDVVRGYLSGVGYVHAGLMMLPIPDSSGAISGLLLAPVASGNAQAGLELGALGTLSFSSDADATGTAGIVLFPGEPPELHTSAPSIDVSLTWGYDQTDPIFWLGQQDGSRLELDAFEATINLSGTVNDPEMIIRLGTAGNGLQAIILPADGDNFVRDLLGENPLIVSGDVDVTWSSVEGVTLSGGLALDVTFPLNLRLFGGVLTIYQLHLFAGFSGSALQVVADINFSTVVGPLTLSLTEIGYLLEAQASSATQSQTFGGWTVDGRFKPPTGGGVGVDLEGIVTGGGYIEYHEDTGEYNGILTLNILSLGITAIVFITTRPPDNPDGWSLLVSINVNFGVTGIQIGFGFNLRQVGGLIGINRTFDSAAVQDGIRTGMLDSILFPDDPIAEAARILTDMSTAFPVAQDSYVFGAMLQLGWGVPPIVTVNLGLIIQVPDVVIALLGQVEAILPLEELPLLEIHFDVVGIIDFAAGTIEIDAGLRNSQIVGFVLTGQVALRASFLNEPSLLLAMGGFHPAFSPPPGFPTLDRLGVGLSVGDWLSISLESYFALTSNTVQFGAGLYMVAKLAAFRAEGGTEINTLIQFSPFQFRSNLNYFISVSAASVELLGVRFTGVVKGPDPYFVKGSAYFKLMGMEQELEIEETIGTNSPLDDVEDVNVAAQVAGSLRDPDNWAAVDSGDRIAAAILADIPPESEIVAFHPGGKVQVSQGIAPLNITLDRYGEAEINGADRLDVTNVESDAGDLQWEYADDWFAPAQFFDLNQTEKLAAPSFELMDSGLVIGGDGSSSGADADAIYDYEQVIIDPEFELPRLLLDTLFRPQASLKLAFEKQNVTRLLGGQRLIQRTTTTAIEVQPTEFLLADSETLTVDPGATAGTTFVEAHQLARESRGTMLIILSSEEQIP